MSLPCVNQGTGYWENPSAESIREGEEDLSLLNTLLAVGRMQPIAQN